MRAGAPEHVDPFRFAAASYLCWWIEVDQQYFRWRSLTEKSLGNFLTRYKVRRTIPGEDLSDLISIIQRQRDILVTEQVVPDLIETTCDSMQACYKRTCLSAVSKVLWMLHGHPIAIFDSFARKGLEQRTATTLSGYGSYHEHWLREFAAAEGQILAAQAWLPRSVLAARLEQYGAATRDELRSWTQERWFANRVFDQFLMNIGSDWSAKRSATVDLARMIDPREG